MDSIRFLENWFRENCDGDWEHSFGVRIETLDNPGWIVEVDLAGTAQEDLALEDVRIERSGQDWVNCRVVDRKFRGAGGPLNLREIVDIFADWIRRSSGTRAP